MIVSSSAKSSLALCCIVKNEAKNLHRCFDSVVPYVDQLVVVDTGSDDATIEIAESYGAEVHHFDWINDFSAARNYSLSFVTCDWVLILDADEEWVVQDQDWRTQLDSAATQFSIVRHDIYEVGDITGGCHLRLFRNVKGLHYRGRYHEQIQFPEDLKSQLCPLTGAFINHHGNSDDNVRDKNINRDIPILEQMREEKTLDLWRLDCLARKYIKVGQNEKSNECYQEALERLTPNLLDGNCPDSIFWIPTLLDTLGSQFLESEDYESAKIVCQRALEWFPLFPPINYLAGELMMALGFHLAASSYFKRCLDLGKSGKFYTGDPFPLDFVQVFPACGLGWAHWKLGDYEVARNYLELALSYKPDYESAMNLKKELGRALQAKD